MSEGHGPGAAAAATGTGAALPLASLCADGLLCGAAEVEREADGFARPQRFCWPQRRALASCLAWHPGLFRQMAATTAGVSVRFATDATEVALAVRADGEPPGTAVVLRELDRPAHRQPHDGVSAVVDGRPLGVAWPAGGMVRLRLDDPAGPGNNTMAIPGLGARHEVCIWLPCLRGCAVRELWADGTYVEPLPARPRLLVLGDSIAQGFVADDPARSWPALLAEALGLELANQSVGGQVFQPSSVLDARLADVAHVVVALGANYRWERCDAQTVAADVRGLLREVARHWPQACAWVLTPTWHDEDASPSHAQSCWRAVPELLRAAVARGGAPAATLVDGLDLLDHSPELLADAEHPNAAGHAQIARRLGAIMGI